MTYTNYTQLVRDCEYLELFDPYQRVRNDDFVYLQERPEEVSHLDMVRLKNIWKEHMQETYEETKKSKGPLGRFLKKYPLKFKEFRAMTELIEDSMEMGNMFSETKNKDVLRIHGIRYESSNLKRFKLVYKIVDPYRPMHTRYEVSYKAQLALKGKKYTDEYQQLDLLYEEQAKRNSPDQLDSLYYIIKPKTGFQDLIANEDLHENLKAAQSREEQKERIFKQWGFGRVVEYGRGTTLNFRGPPGTGKTLAAHCLANELGKKLLMVRYDQLQGMFVGETEKHIQTVFKMAKMKDAVLFFDEADAIALSRENLQQSWEMSQVNTLLKELERFDGVCVFATNFSDKYDKAFERRLTMHLDFTLPTGEQSNLIFDKVLPKRARDKKSSFARLKLTGFSGGDIKNIALNAAGIATKENAPKIRREHVEQAILLVRGGKSTGSKDTSYFG